MKIQVCKVCGHIEFDVLPERCPVCGAAKTQFVEDASAIKAPANPPSDLDKKHVPKIVVVKECGLIPGGGCTDVHVKVGEVEHVMEPEHWIKFVDYYIDMKFIARVEFAPAGCHPAAALHVKTATGKLTAVENCNKHGYWIAEASL